MDWDTNPSSIEMMVSRFSIGIQEFCMTKPSDFIIFMPVRSSGNLHTLYKHYYETILNIYIKS